MKFTKFIAASILAITATSAMAQGSVGVQVHSGGQWAISGTWNQPWGWGHPGWVVPRPVPFSPWGIPPNVSWVQPQFPVFVQQPSIIVQQPVPHQHGTQFSWIYDQGCQCYIGRYK